MKKPKAYKKGGPVFNRGGIVPGTGDKKLGSRPTAKGKACKMGYAAGGKVMCKGF